MARRRSVIAEMRRIEREALRRAKAAEKAWKAAQKVAAVEAARLEVEAFDTQLEALTSLHRECTDPVDWAALARRPAPAAPKTPPPVDRRRSERARLDLSSYRPSFFARIFGLTGQRIELERRLDRALEAEATAERTAREEHAQALKAWNTATETWKSTRELAEEVLAGGDEAYGEAIQATGCLAELAESLGLDELRVEVDGDRAELTLSADEDTLVPAEQKTLTARGAVSSKKLPAARRTEIYQDYVCGAALRAGREILAVTPLDSVLVHVETILLDTSTGRRVPRPILSVSCSRAAFRGVNWDKVDASDLVETLVHRMKLTRGKGFKPVEKLGRTASSS
jgi:hypothetical protein